MKSLKLILCSAALLLLAASGVRASGESDLAIPNLNQGHYDKLWNATPWQVLFYGALVILGTLSISLYQLYEIRKYPAHKSMLDVAQIIFQTCKTYLIQQGKFLLMLFVLIGSLMSYYYLGLHGKSRSKPPRSSCSSRSSAWPGPTRWPGTASASTPTPTARTAFASLRGKPWDVVNIPLRAGMSVGLFLISLELVMMVIILLFVPREIVGYCFLGFAIGESLGASALRIAGGIFTKIADIGSDLMKIVFNVKEDDPRNPGVIADCTGDNAGDSVGPTADGFETYGVTGVALIAFITLAVNPGNAGADYQNLQAKLIVWIFAMRFLMDFMSGISYFVNQAISEKLYEGKSRVRLRAAADAPDLDRGHPVHLDLVPHELAAAQRPRRCRDATSDPSSGGSWRRIISCGTLGGGADPRVHQDLHQLPLQARPRDRHRVPRRRRVADDPVRPGRGQLQRLLDGPAHRWP